ncbi:MAG: hypothetical protein ACOCVK_01985 [bacterium]
MQRSCIDDCAWPELAARYDVALREAVGFILKRFPQTVAITAAGTILRGTPSAASDLDLYVIHEAAYQQRLLYFFSGVPAEIFVNPKLQVHTHLLRSRADRRAPDRGAHAGHRLPRARRDRCPGETRSACR